jgi:hypothetical protein
MLVTNLQPKVYQLSYICFGFVMMTLYVVLEGQVRNIDRLALLSLWVVQQGIDLTQIGVVAMEELGLLLLDKPKYPLVNLVRDSISAPMNQLLICAPHNLFNNGTFAPLYKPLDLDAWPK